MRNSELKAPYGVVMFIGSPLFDIRQKEGSLWLAKYDYLFRKMYFTYRIKSTLS